MSGVLSALEASGGLFAGFGALTLGPVIFYGFEVPERVNIGGEQALVVHKLPGGQRVIDAMGRNDAEIEWQGVFLSIDASARARTLDALRTSGAVLTLTWEAFNYSVVVSRFTASFLRSNHVPYSICCTVLADNSAQFTQPTPALSDNVSADLGLGLAAFGL